MRVSLQGSWRRKLAGLKKKIPVDLCLRMPDWKPLHSFFSPSFAFVCTTDRGFKDANVFFVLRILVRVIYGRRNLVTLAEETAWHNCWFDLCRNRFRFQHEGFPKIPASSLGQCLHEHLVWSLGWSPMFILNVFPLNVPSLHLGVEGSRFPQLR